MKWLSRYGMAFVGLTVIVAASSAADWTRFRGPNGSGISSDPAEIPAKWSDDENLKWKAELPGPGSSCPIVVGDRIFLTCWTGYADDPAGENGEGGSLENLKRHLVCIDRTTGKILWNSAVDAVLPEDAYRGMFAENGYATHTPVSDGERVYVFFGKSGVHAYSMDGDPLWQADVGQDRDRRGWGTASSPILYKNLVIVTATIENHAIVALDKASGKEVWKQEAEGFGSTWGTPVLVETAERTELVIGVPYEIWSLNPDTGKLLWYCESIGSDSMCSSVTAHDGVIFAIESGPRGGGAVAIRAGGTGDVTETHVLWKANHRSRVATPVVHDGRLYFISSGIANCIDIKTGDRIYQSRLSGANAATGEVGGGRAGRGGYGRGQDYSSPVIGDGKLFYARRSGDVFVVKLGPEFEQLSVNRFASFQGDFHATPAISDGQLFLRSSHTLYCVAGTE